MAKVKFDKLKGDRSIAWTGTDAAESFVAGSFVDVLRGKGGNDTLAGAANRDWFVFEATLSENGVDVITDLQVMGRPKEHDVLDLTKVLGKEVIRRNVDQFVRVAGDQLLVRPSGSGSWETWATLTGFKEGDRIKIRPPRFYDGILAGPSEDQTSYDTIVVGRDASGNSLYWGDVDKDGKYDPGDDIDLELDSDGFLSDSDGKVDYSAKNYTVVFQALNINPSRPQPDPALDLAGFDAQDKLVVDYTVFKRMGIQIAGTSPTSVTFKASTFLGPATKARVITSLSRVSARTSIGFTGPKNTFAYLQITLRDGVLELDTAQFKGVPNGFADGRTTLSSIPIAKNIVSANATNLVPGQTLIEFFLPTIDA